jgi:ANTAR domain/GAF domain
MTDTTGQGRERALAEAFVRLADTLIADFDVIDVLHELTTDCVSLLPVDAAGLLLSDQRGALRAVSASSEQATLVELFQLQADQGPCLDAFHTSAQVHAPDLAADAVAGGRWPRFAAHAVQAGYGAVHALPLRLRARTIGALNLFTVEPGPLADADLQVAQALAAVATIVVLQDRTSHESELLTEQLQATLTSRIIIEQATGVLVERGRVEFGDAFTLLRRYSRASSRRLGDVARDVVEGSLDAHKLLHTAEQVSAGEIPAAEIPAGQAPSGQVPGDAASPAAPAPQRKPSDSGQG